MFGFLNKALYASGVVKTAVSSATEYLVRGPRCPKWTLAFQLQRDLMHYTICYGFVPELTDDTPIDLEMVTVEIAKYDLPATQAPPESALTQSSHFKVPKVNASIFGGFEGPAQPGLQALATQDQQARYARVITYEMVTPIEHDGGFNCVPLGNDRRIVLYFHGGRYSMGSAASHRELVSRLAGISKVRFMPINYRLAPLYPFPCQLYDGYLAFQYLVEQGFKPADIILAGDSAGGNLVMVLWQLLKSVDPEYARVRGLVLISPWLEMDITCKSAQTNRDYDYLIETPLKCRLNPVRTFYKPGEPLTDQYRQDIAHPHLSPMRGNHQGLPPMLVQTGDGELMVDDIKEFYQGVLKDNPTKDASSKYVYEGYPDMVHVFHRFADRLEDAREGIRSAGKFIYSL